ncbi:MAG: hypothetical protein JXB17_13100 [Bacteroidales bacterium]|nr:hypothetical protein [Bacteroidales bacterium]
MNKTLFTFIIINLFLSAAVSAQKHGEGGYRYRKSEIIKEEKVKFFNEKLNLTQEESSKFWPVYNDYQNRREYLLNERRNLMDYLNENAGNMNEQEIDKKINILLLNFTQESEMMNEYYSKIKEILPPQKAAKIFGTEHQFKEYLFQCIRENKNLKEKGNKNN